MEDPQALLSLHDKLLDGYKTILKDAKKLRLSGWRGFKLHLKNDQGLLSTDPVIKGIYSVGGKDAVKPWMDLDYREELEFEGQENRLSLTEGGLDHKLFRTLADIIPPGGHLMVSYEGEQNIHSETRKSLSLGVPSASTPLGFLIFQAGFHLVKDWYLAEGGFEGPRKLWGEKAPDKKWARTFLEKTERQISEFMEKKSPQTKEELLNTAIQRSKEILNTLRKKT